MNSYWDLSEKERAELSEQGIEAFVAFELMQKGVLPPREPELVEVPEVEPSRKTYFAPRYNNANYSWPETANVAFTSEQAAREAIKGMVHIEEQRGTGVAVARFITQVATVEAVTYEDHERLRADLERAKAAKSANEAESKRYQKECSDREEALKGMWSDWHECREQAATMERIKTTMAEYVELAGDARKASAFLRKAFDETVILDAVEWCGFEYFQGDQPKETAATPKEERQEIQF